MVESLRSEVKGFSVLNSLTSLEPFSLFYQPVPGSTQLIPAQCSFETKGTHQQVRTGSGGGTAWIGGRFLSPVEHGKLFAHLQV